jgi:hypothetical protein
VVELARKLKLLSDEHFTVDNTLVEAWASLKNFKRKDRGPEQPPDGPGNPHGELPRRTPQQAGIAKRCRFRATLPQARTHWSPIQACAVRASWTCDM